MSQKNVDVFQLSRNRLKSLELVDAEEKKNAEYAQRHNLQALFNDFADQLRQKDPKTEQEAERVLLEFLSHRKAERDRAALRLHFKKSFEVSMDNDRKNMKLTLGKNDNVELRLIRKGRSVNGDTTCAVTLEQSEELTELFYELGRFVADGPSGEQAGFISIDEKDVYILAGSRDCVDVGDELFELAFHISVNAKKGKVADK